MREQRKPLYATINGLQYRREGFHLLKEYVSQYMPEPPVDYFAGRPSGSADAHPWNFSVSDSSLF